MTKPRLSRLLIWRLLLPVAICLGVAGYVVYDWDYIHMNLVMRDAQTVRDDCVHLLKLRKTATPEDNPFL